MFISIPASSAVNTLATDSDWASNSGSASGSALSLSGDAVAASVDTVNGYNVNSTNVIDSIGNVYSQTVYGPNTGSISGYQLNPDGSAVFGSGAASVSAAGAFSASTLSLTGNAITLGSRLLASATTGLTLDGNATGLYSVKILGGAVGDGVTDDTAAINTAITNLPTGGTLFFPAGKYVTSGNHAIAKSMTIRGEGMGYWNENGDGSFNTSDYGTLIMCSSGSNPCFNVTSDAVHFQNLEIFNTSGTTPVSGSAGILTNSTHWSQQVNYTHIAVVGFYINFDIQVGTMWKMIGCDSSNPVQYHCRIDNTVYADAGDWYIAGCNFSAGQSTSQHNSQAGLLIRASGGGKIIGNKFIGGVLWGIELHPRTGVTTGQLIISGNSMEGFRSTGGPLHFTSDANATWTQIIVNNNYLRAESQSPIFIDNSGLGTVAGFNIVGNILLNTSGTTGVTNNGGQGVNVVGNVLAGSAVSVAGGTSSTTYSSNYATGSAAYAIETDRVVNLLNVGRNSATGGQGIRHSSASTSFFAVDQNALGTTQLNGKTLYATVNNGSIVWSISASGQLCFPSLPTSNSGLPSGGLWKDTSSGNVIKAV